jgi:hypothetical protein
MTADDRYSTWLEIEDNNEQDRGQNDDEIDITQRAAHLIFPSTSFLYPLNRINDYRNFNPAKRQSFGRKHHWDAFFGRR